MRFPLIFISLLLLVNPLIALSAEENPPAIVYAIGPPAPPLYDLQPGSQYGWQGLFIDLLDEILVKELGHRLVFKQYPWKRAQQNIKEGAADITVAALTEERLEYSFKSDEPILKMYLYVYTYADHPQIEKIRQIKSPQDIMALGLLPATNQGNSWHKENIDAFGVKTFYVPNDENLVQFLAMQRADIIIDAPITMNPLIKQFDLTAKIVQTDVRFGPVNFHLLVSKKSPYASLLPKINEVIHRLERQGTLERMALQYSRLK